MDREKKKQILLIVLTILAVFILLILFGIAIYYFVSREPVKDYAVVFDAGSSGSRQYIYEWNADYTSKLSDKLQIKEISSCKTDDQGIHRINTYSDLVSKFEKCMNKSLQVVPENRRNRTKISLAATAGMRLLQVNSKSVSNDIFQLIRQYFARSGFLFQNNSQVKVISGRDEALNAWISANYFENNFNQLNNKDLDQKTKGIIDLGGASTQVVFVPKNPDPSRTESIKLFGVNYPTYSQSFLCFGLNEANLMYRASLLKAGRFMASCYPRNSVVPLEKLQLNRSPCANGFIFNENMPYEALQKDHNFYGDSNYDRCREDVKYLFMSKKPCKTGTDSCSFKNAFIADVKTSKFLAISSFWYASLQTTKLLNQSHKNDIEEFKRLTYQICSMDLERLAHLNQVNKGGIDSKRLPELCFTNVYVMELLDNYGFTNLENVKFVDEVNGFSVGWTLGYLINELNNQQYLPVEDIPRKLSAAPFIFISFMLILLIVTAIGLLLTYLIKRNQPAQNASA